MVLPKFHGFYEDFIAFRKASATSFRFLFSAIKLISNSSMGIYEQLKLMQQRSRDACE